MFSPYVVTCAADTARKHGGQTVAEEGASHVGIKIAPRHGGDGLDVAEVFSHQNDDHGSDEHDGARVEHGRLEVRKPQPGGLQYRLKVDGLAQPHDVGQNEIDHVGAKQSYEDEKLLQ